jgi:hypothetical protein
MSNILNEELGRMKSLFSYEKGKVISEQERYVTPQTASPQTQAQAQQFYSKLYNGIQNNPQTIVNCAGISTNVMDTPTQAQQSDFAQKSGLNPNVETNKQFFCSLQKMSAKLAEIQKVGATTQNKPDAPPQIPTELKNIDGVKKFQDWLDTNKAGWATGYPNNILNKSGKGYGRMGPRTQKAWGLYKTEFLTPTAEVKPITQQEIATINATDKPVVSKTAVTAPTNITAPNVQNLVPAKTPQEYYEQLVSMKLIDPVGGNRIVYKGEPPADNIKKAISDYLTTQGYTQKLEKNKNNGKIKLVYTK